ncbi:MAG TPA: hypothetical protein VFQ87_03175 [Bradyrhizobium sp.]|jgi:hypothetical protein|nr:hypothetical protein [Bradyrhizobium sp.]
MKSHQGGTHEPGLRRAGAGEDEPTHAEFAALVARVAALEAAPAGGGAGGKLYRTLVVRGLDATGGDVDPGSEGALEESGLTLAGWRIVSAARWQNSDGIGGVYNHGWVGGIDIFYNPVGSSGVVTFKGGNDYTAYTYLLLLQSPGEQPSPSQASDLAGALEQFRTDLHSDAGGKGLSMVGMWSGLLPVDDPQFVAANGVQLIGALAHSAHDTAAAAASELQAFLAPLLTALTDADLVTDVNHSLYVVYAGVLTADRTVTLSPDDATTGFRVCVAFKAGPPGVGTSFGGTVAVVNGGPAAGTLFTLGAPPFDGRPYAAFFRFNGTDYELVDHYRLEG